MNILLLILGFFTYSHSGYFDNDSEKIDQKVIENRTSKGGIYYSFQIKNKGTGTLMPNTYEIEFRVDGKLVSFDKATSGIKPGQTITYKSQKTFYPSKKRPSIFYELVTKIKYKNPSEVILHGKSEF